MPAEITSISTTNANTTHRLIVNTRGDDVQPVGFHSYRLYRNATIKMARELVAERTAWAQTYAINDFYFPAGTFTYDWVRVTGGAAGPEELIETQGPAAPLWVDYWLIHPTNRSFDMHLYGVNTDEFSTEIESETINLIGRGRKEDRGDVWGKVGSISCQLRDKPGWPASLQRLELEDASEEPSPFYLFSPFGDRWFISMEPPQFTRLPGVGQSELFDASFGYKEVS